MFSRGIRKQKRSLSIPIVKPNSFLAVVLTNNIDIPSYFNCANRGFPFYEVSLLELSRCIRYIQSNKFGYDIIGVIPSQFQNIISQHIRLKSELEETLTKVSRLQQQKKL